MLFQSRFHAGIVAGEITLTFRLWSSARVRPDRRYRCPPIGLLEVESVVQVAAADVLDAEARLAGFDTRANLLDYIQRSSRKSIGLDTQLHRVAFRYLGAGPSAFTALPASITQQEIEALAAKLQATDRRSRRPWTQAVLECIAANPRVPAARLCDAVGFEKAPFKANVRKLKGLGLTTSFEVGYELTAGGQKILEFLSEPPPRPRSRSSAR